PSPECGTEPLRNRGRKPRPSSFVMTKPRLRASSRTSAGLRLRNNLTDPSPESLADSEPFSRSDCSSVVSSSCVSPLDRRKSVSLIMISYIASGQTHEPRCEILSLSLTRCEACVYPLPRQEECNGCRCVEKVHL